MRNHRLVGSLLVLMLLVFALACEEEVQEEPTEERPAARTVELHGEVHDIFGQPLEGVTVSAEDGSAESVTDEEGAFSIDVHHLKMSPLDIYKEGYTMERVETRNRLKNGDPIELYLLPPDREGAYRLGDEGWEELPVTELEEGNHPSNFELTDEDIAAFTLPTGHSTFSFGDLEVNHLKTIGPSRPVTFSAGGVTLRPIESTLPVKDGDDLEVQLYNISPGQWAIANFVESEESSMTTLIDQNLAIIFTAE